MSDQEESQRKIKNKLEGVCFLTGLRTVMDSPEELAQGPGEREVWIYLLKLLDLQPDPR